MSHPFAASFCCLPQNVNLGQPQAQMAQVLSKEEFITIFRLMRLPLWTTLIEEEGVPTIPRWRSLGKVIPFWEMMVARGLCRYARRAVLRWSHISAGLMTQQRSRHFWSTYERSDPSREAPVGPRTHYYTVNALAPPRYAPPRRRRQRTRRIHAPQFSTLLSVP